MPRSILLLALLAGLALAQPANAAVDIDSFTVTPSTDQAGGHPDIVTEFSFADPGQPESARDIDFRAPEGLFGNVNAITQCTQASFAERQCPSNSQAGLVTVWANHEGDSEAVLGTAPVYSIDAGIGATALFAFTMPTLGIPVQIPVTVRTGSDYGLDFTVTQVSQVAPIAAVKLTLWGFPADDVNNPNRFPKGLVGCPGIETTSCGAGAKSSEPERPLTSNPTVCSGIPLSAGLRVRSYQDQSGEAVATADYPAITGCERIGFQPSINVGLTTGETDSPTGLSLSLQNPQLLTHAFTPSQVRLIEVALPAGLTINPDAADGQTACSDAQANVGNDAAAACPDSSKIGSFELINPSLKGPLRGAVYIGESRPGDQYRILMVASGYGMNAKLGASLMPDPATGRIALRTDQLPQVPFSEFRVNLFGSDRGMLATPTHCAVYEVSARFLPWASQQPDLGSSQIFSLDAGPDGKPCPPAQRPFAPRLAAGTTNPVAGAFSDFGLKLDRDDGDQFIRDLEFQMPPGFTGSLRGIPYCSEVAIAAAAGKPGRTELAAPSCPTASLVGSANVAAGPGAQPFHAHGRMYLAGPLKGAPLSLALVTPALAGPYDYGTIVVRVALHVDPLTAQVRAVSDTVPQIVGGVPLRMRSVEVDIDRPNFTINPTNCSRFAVFSRGIGDQGAVADFSSPFNAVNCASLRFRPRMAVRQLGGKKKTRRAQNAAMRFELRTRGGDANIRRVKVTLPKAFAIDQRHLANICSKSQLEREQCAGRQAIGKVLVRTPLLDEPLQGPAYAVSGFGKLPRLAFILDGQVRLVPQAESASNKMGQLRTIVPVIPDAPIGYFRLDLLGGKKGYLVNTRSLCGSANRVRVDYVAQNGRKLTQKVKPRTSCAKRVAKRSAQHSSAKG